MKNINNLLGSITSFKGTFLNALYHDTRFKASLRSLKKNPNLPPLKCVHSISYHAY